MPCAFKRFGVVAGEQAQPDPTKNMSLDSATKDDTPARVTAAEMMDDDSDFEGFDSDEDEPQPLLQKGVAPAMAVTAPAPESAKATCEVHSNTTAADGCTSQAPLSLSDDDDFDGFDSDD